MGGTTITIQNDNLICAINELNKQQKEIEDNCHLFLDSLTILGKDLTNKYNKIGDFGIELSIGLNYATEKIIKDIVIFAHFGK